MLTALFVTAMSMVIVSWVTRYYLIRRLRAHHVTVWKSFGSPTWLEAQTSNLQVFRFVLSRRVSMLNDEVVSLCARIERSALFFALVSSLVYILVLFRY